MEWKEKRQVILDEVRRWRAEGLVDEATAARLEARYAAAAPALGDAAARDAETAGPALGPAEGPGAADAFPAGRAGRGGASFASNAMQLVGGLLLGAGLVAFVLFLDPQRDAVPWTLLLLGAPALAGGLVLGRVFPARAGLSEALVAAGLIPLAVGALASGDTAQQAVGLLVAASGVATHVLREGRTPTILLAGAAFSIGVFAALDPFDAYLSDMTLQSLATVGAHLAYFGLLLRTRGRTWTTVALGLFMLPLALSFLILLENLGVEDSLVVEGLLGLWFASFLTLGIWMGDRGLVAGAAAGLTVDTLVFAFDLGGALMTVVALLLLGGMLVWQAEVLRSYFSRGRQGPS